MDRLLSSLKSFVRRNKGQDLLEYALIVALIALFSLGAVAASGGSVGGIFDDIAAQLGTAVREQVELFINWCRLVRR